MGRRRRSAVGDDSGGQTDDVDDDSGARIKVTAIEFANSARRIE
jgi:hypothetical protein